MSYFVRSKCGALFAGCVIALGLPTGSPLAAQVVPNDLPVGACVTAYGNSGRIVDHVQGGYRVASDSDPNGTPFVAAAASVTQTACKTAAPTPTMPARRAAMPAAPPANRPRGGSCFASSTGPLSGSARTFASLIIGNWAAPAPFGADGAVTVRVDALSVGASRRATFYDRDNATLDARAPVTPIVARVTRCTDYRTRLDYREVQENFLCYTKATGGLACGEIAHTGNLPQPRDWSIDK